MANMTIMMSAHMKPKPAVKAQIRMHTYEKKKPSLVITENIQRMHDCFI